MFHAISLEGHRWMALAGGLSVSLALASCTAASPAATNTPSMNMGAESTAPGVSNTASPTGPVRCAVTPDVSPSATIEVVTDSLGIVNFGPGVSIKAGEAVAFTNGNTSRHTITEGTYGEAVDGACVDASLENITTVIVTFYEPGEYKITCRPHPIMQTSVTVE